MSSFCLPIPKTPSLNFSAYTQAESKAKAGKEEEDEDEE